MAPGEGWSGEVAEPLPQARKPLPQAVDTATAAAGGPAGLRPQHCAGGVLYCTVLYCTVLYCTVLYCIVLYCTVLYCTVLYCTVLYCTVGGRADRGWRGQLYGQEAGAGCQEPPADRDRGQGAAGRAAASG